jgi:hypothetical protein
MEAAQRDGVGAIRLHGAVVDEAHVWTAKQELRKAARFGLVPAWCPISILVACRNEMMEPAVGGQLDRKPFY